jgi:hypothetical protein
MFGAASLFYGGVTRREKQPERCRDDDERCNLKQAHDGLLSYARPKFWDSARVTKTNAGLDNNELML